MSSISHADANLDIDVTASDARHEQFRKETLVALHDFETTGLHLSGAEVDQWMSRLEAGEDVDPPECHI